jgi:hypothetical protein
MYIIDGDCAATSMKPDGDGGRRIAYMKRDRPVAQHIQTDPSSTFDGRTFYVL